MRDGHCHSHQVVFETAGGVCPQKVLCIIANICLHVHMYGFACTHMHSVCDCVSFLNVHLPFWCQQCCGLVYLRGIICIYLFSVLACFGL